MKKIVLLFILINSVLAVNAQCNIKNQTVSLSSIDTECSGYTIDGNLNNSIIVTGSCGKLVFTPPITDKKHKTATENIEKYTKLSIAPNPFVQDITISIESESRLARITITNILGNIVFTKSDFDFNTTGIRLNLSDLSPGAYFILFEANNKIIATKKLLKLNL